jgi:phosphate transport system substrate-binding protein
MRRRECIGLSCHAVPAAAALLLAIILSFPAFAQQKTEGAIRAKGSALMANAVNDLAKEYAKTDPKAVIIVSGGGTVVGFTDFLAKNVELVLATRDMTQEERATAQTNGISPASAIIGWGCVTIITHPKNPVNELTLDQVKAIFTGKVTSWKDLGGPDKPVEVHIIDPERVGTNLYFRNAVLDGTPYVPAATVEPDWGALVRHVAANETSVAFCLLNKTIEAAGKIKALAIKKDKDSPAAFPSWKAAEDRSYPISRPLYLFWDEATASPLLKQFVEFCKKQGLQPR